MWMNGEMNSLISDLQFHHNWGMTIFSQWLRLANQKIEDGPWWQVGKPEVDESPLLNGSRWSLAVRKSQVGMGLERWAPVGFVISSMVWGYQVMYAAHKAMTSSFCVYYDKARWAFLALGHAHRHRWPLSLTVWRYRRVSCDWERWIQRKQRKNSSHCCWVFLSVLGMNSFGGCTDLQVGSKDLSWIWVEPLIPHPALTHHWDPLMPLCILTRTPTPYAHTIWIMNYYYYYHFEGNMATLQYQLHDPIGI